MKTRAEYARAYYLKHSEEIRLKSKKYYDSHKEARAAATRAWYKIHKKEAAARLQSNKGKWLTYQIEAKKRGLQWNLSRELFDSLIDAPCRYHGGPQASRGVDRVDNKKGYVPDNCVPCCHMCNLMKRGWSYQEFISRVLEIADYYELCIAKRA